MLELLSPAGSMEALRAAVCNGADAVYLGAGSFNARAGARNFTAEELDLLSAAVQDPQPRHTAQAALDDSKRIILEEFRKRNITSGEDLAALRTRLKQTKGYGG